MKEFEPTQEELKVINAVIKRHFRIMSTTFYHDDLKSLGLYATWMARKTFDDSKGVKYTTYQWKMVFNELYVFKRSQMCRKKDIPNDVKISKDYDLENDLEERMSELSFCFENDVDFQIDFDSFYNTLKPIEKCILFEFYKGATLKEVGETVGMTFQGVDQRRKKIKQNYQNFKTRGVC